MKKLALSLLLSTAIITQNIKATGTTTDLGPIQLITTTGSNQFAAGTVKLNGVIEIGQSNTNDIFVQGSNITAGSNVGSDSIITVLSVDSANQMVSGPLTKLGSSGNNNILCPAGSGDLAITSLNAGNIVLNSASHIKLVASGDITNPSTSPVLIAVDQNGDIKTSNNAAMFVFGDKDGANTSFISVDNSTSTPTGIILSTANTSASNIKLDAGASNSIIVVGNGIVYPSLGETRLLLIDSNGAVQTVTETTPFVCGNLTAAGSAAGQTIALGDSTYNYIGFTNNSGDVTVKAMGTSSNLLLSADQGITLSSPLLTPTVNSTPTLTVLALDRSGNLVTSDKSEIFIYGNDGANKNYIQIDNDAASNGITIGGEAVYLKGQGLAPAAGYVNVLTIDENGKVGIIVSSARYKEDIRSLEIKENELDSLEAVSYKYTGKDHVEYGFIAEELAKNELLKNTVIFNQSGEAMSVNYNAVFVAVTQQFIKTKKALQQRVASLEDNLLKKDIELAKLASKYIQLENALKELSQKLA